jgi:hypothetical protein
MHREQLMCRNGARRQAISAALERRALEDAEAEAKDAEDRRRLKEEIERSLKTADEKLRADEERRRWVEEEIKNNKKAKAK